MFDVQNLFGKHSVSMAHQLASRAVMDQQETTAESRGYDGLVSLYDAIGKPLVSLQASQ